MTTKTGTLSADGATGAILLRKGESLTYALTASATEFRTIAAQTEADFDDTGDNGDFTGGSGYSVNDVITLSDGSTVTVDAVSTGVVSEFTVTTATVPGEGGTTANATLTQASVAPTGGTGFTLILGDDNETAVPFEGSVRLEYSDTAGKTWKPVAVSANASITSATLNDPDRGLYRGAVYGMNAGASVTYSLVTTPYTLEEWQDRDGVTQVKITSEGVEMSALSVGGAAVAGAIGCTITASDGGADEALVDFQLDVAAAHIVTVYLSDDAGGVGLTSTEASGDVVAGADGEVFGTLEAKKALVVQTDATGLFQLSITDSQATGFVPCISIGAQAPIAGAALTASDYGS